MSYKQMVHTMYTVSGENVPLRHFMQHSVFYIADSDMYLNNTNTHRKHCFVFTSNL